MPLKTERRRSTKAHHHHLKDNVCRLLQMPIRLTHQGCVQALVVFLVRSRWSKFWKGPFGRRCSHVLCVPEILQMGVKSHNWNNAGKYGPFCELFFFLMKHEPADGEALVGWSFGLCVITCGPSNQGVLGLRSEWKGAQGPKGNHGAQGVPGLSHV